ncbi:MAG: M28 family peptidase [Aphanothece sp. CMT-3BRIN-NPC111]|jgi:Zn-dependent M28 family amino/carboxypeptidase|nr:M28 family peptidase [Aphanothece sp. CMT-3BRIN-NPC111]
MKKWIWVTLLITIAAVGTIFIHKYWDLAGGNWHPMAQTSHLTDKSTLSQASSQQQYSASTEIENSAVASTPQAVTAPQVSAERLFAHVKALAFERYTHVERRRARNYISQVLKASGWSPTLESFKGGVNVVAQRPGIDPKAGTILVAAHYDTVEGSPGADDNATGVATVLEVARLLGSRPTPRTLQIALFDQEEEGLIGSRAFTSSEAHLSNLHGAIILDMVGFACYTPGCQQYPTGLPVTPPTDWGDFIAVVGDLEHLPLLNTFQQASQPNLPPVLAIPIPFKGLATPDVLRSDHAPFWYQGIGAVMVSDTGNFRTPHYHQASDTPETIDQKFFAGTAQIVVNATATLLESGENLAK